jgi:hypothetical protein
MAVVALITVCKLLRLDEYWVVVGYCHLEFWPYFVSILELILFGGVAIYVVSLNIHIVVMFKCCVGSC